MDSSVTHLTDAAIRTYAWFGLLVSRGYDMSAQPTKVKKEAIEFAEDPTIEELADVFITVIGAASVKGWSMDELAVAVDTKMAINEKRNWRKTDDGTYQHTED